MGLPTLKRNTNFIMVSRECNKCKISKPITEYYSREGTCKLCRKQRMKNLYHGMPDLADDDAGNVVSGLGISSPPSDGAYDENMQLRHEMELMKTVIEGLHNDITAKDVAMSHYQQITAKMENMLQEMHDKIAELSGEVTGLHSKVAELEAVNAKLETNAEMTRRHVDLVDENLQRNVAVSEQLHGIMDNMGKDTRKIKTAVIGLSGKMGYHSRLVYEMGDAYYQFIMGNANKYDVKLRLAAKGYVVYEKRDNGVD
jgi:hypothetical protein